MYQKIKIILLCAVITVLPSATAQAQTAGLPPVENNVVFVLLTRLQNIYLSYYDRLCLNADLDGMPVVVVAIQPDRFHFEAVIFRLDNKTPDMAGYHIKLDGDMAHLDPVAASGLRSQSSRMPNIELWNIPVFSSQFHMGDFLPSLFLQLKFSSITEKEVDGNPRIYLSSHLTVGEAKENREIVLEIDKISGVPRGFVVQSLNKKRLRSINILTYGNYMGKSYGREATVSDHETGKKSKVSIKQMSALKPGIFLSALANVTPSNWQNFCNLDGSSTPSKSSQDTPVILLKPAP